MKSLRSPPFSNIPMTYPAIPYKIAIIKNLLPMLGFIPILL